MVPSVELDIITVAISYSRQPIVSWLIENDSPPCSALALLSVMSSDVARKLAAAALMSMTGW